jgi:uncharacterized protein (TIGR02266 family)
MGGKRSKRHGKKNRGTNGVASTSAASSAANGPPAAHESPPSAAALEVVEAIAEAVAPPLFETAEPEVARPHEQGNGSASTVAAESPLEAASPDTVRMDPLEAATDDVEDLGAATRREREHRTHPRVSIAVDIDLESESHFFTGVSGDVSEGGLFVQTYRAIEIGREVAVEFELPDGHVTAHGRVRWHRDKSDSAPPGLGIAFDELSDEDREIIHRFCERREPLYYEVEHA